MKSNLETLQTINELEFDWFPNESFEQIQRDEYADLIDFKTENIEIRDIEIPKIKEIKNNQLRTIMHANIEEIHESLCKNGFEYSFEYLNDYLEQLKTQCEVLTTDLSKCTESEFRIKVEQTLFQEGCLLLCIDNHDWQNESSFLLDDGVRVIEIVDICAPKITIKDYQATQEEYVEIDISKLLNISGQLVEVLK